MKTNRLFPVFLIVFVDLLGFGLILPLLPYYAESFGASAFATGLLVASYAAGQLVGAPMLGRLSDRFGRKPLLLVSLAGTLAGFLLLAAAPILGEMLAPALALPAATVTLGLLFISRIVDGLTGGNISIAQAYITDVTDENNRAKGLGLIGAAFGLGFIFGPVTGGFLSRWGFAVPALAAAALSALNLGLVAFRLPESLTAESRAILAGRPRGGVTADALRTAVGRPLVRSLLSTRFFYGLAFAIFQSIFSLYVLSRFQLSAGSTGLILAYVGILSVVVQGFVVARLVRHFADRWLILGGILMLGLSLFGWAAAPSVGFLLAILAPMALAGGALNTVLSSALTRAVRPEEVGGTLGLSSAIESLTRVIAPSLGGVLLQSLGTAAPGILAGGICMLLAANLAREISLPAKLIVSTPACAADELQAQ